ncbi:unnamed protein product, partial [Didymodactylos carnosus]
IITTTTSTSNTTVLTTTNTDSTATSTTLATITTTGSKQCDQSGPVGRTGTVTSFTFYTDNTCSGDTLYLGAFTPTSAITAGASATFIYISSQWIHFTIPTVSSSSFTIVTVNFCTAVNTPVGCVANAFSIDSTQFYGTFSITCGLPGVVVSSSTGCFDLILNGGSGCTTSQLPSYNTSVTYTRLGKDILTAITIS